HIAPFDLLLAVGEIEGLTAFGLPVHIGGLVAARAVGMELFSGSFGHAGLEVPALSHLPIGLVGGHFPVQLAPLPVLGAAQHALAIVVVPCAVLLLAHIAAMGHQLPVGMEVPAVRGIAARIMVDAAFHFALGAVMDKAAHRLIVLELAGVAQLRALRPS